jgi:DNA processing protein
MSDLRYWIWLAQSGIRPLIARRCLDAAGSVKELFLADPASLGPVEGMRAAEAGALARKDISAAEAIEEQCRTAGIRILCLPDADYPDRLRSIEDPPLVIYIKGKLPPVDDRLCIGVVGTRKASDYGRETAARLAGELAQRGGVVVTGLADGIDSAAARGALRTRGAVIAVLGTGVDVVYPAGNENLQAEVAAHGALVSEFPPGTGATRYGFPRRNRIISGLSLGVAVIQAPAKSGALITAAHAQEQGRDVFVIPGAVDDPGFLGSNDLIRDGAQLIRGADDILEEYRFRYPAMLAKMARIQAGDTEKPTKEAIDKAQTVDYSSLAEQLESLTEQELKLVEVLTAGAGFKDELIRRSGLAAPAAMAALTMLQLKGYAREENGRYRLVVRYRDPGEV